MEKLKGHLKKFGILYVLGIVVIGLYVGSQWDKWFPKGANVSRKNICHDKKCCDANPTAWTSGGVPCAAI